MEVTVFEKILTGFGKLLFVMILGVPFAFLSGLILMVSVGAVHGWIPAVPTVGFWTAVLIAYGLSVLSPFGTKSD